MSIRGHGTRALRGKLSTGQHEHQGTEDVHRASPSLASTGDSSHRLVITLQLAGMLILAAVLIIVMATYRVGYFATGRQAMVAAAFPGLLLVLSLLCLLLARRGYLRAASRIYVWGIYLGVVSVAVLFNGYRSATWLLLLWPVTMAGILLKPISAIWLAVASLALYGVSALAELAGWYVPPLPTETSSFRAFGLAFGWLMILMVAGFTTFLEQRSLRRALANQRDATFELMTARQRLEEEVSLRTADLVRRAEEFRAIAELGQAASSIQDLDSLMETTVALIGRRLGFYHVGLFLLDAHQEWAVLQAASSEGGQRMLARGHRLRVGQQGIVGYVAAAGSPRVALDVEIDSTWVENPDLPETRSEMALPLKVAGEVIGVLDIQSEEPAAFTEEDVETLQILADSVAVAIRNAQLLEAMRETLDRLQRYQEQDALRAWRQALARRGLVLAYDYQGKGTVTRRRSTEFPHAVAGEPLNALQRVDRHVTADGRHLLLAPITVGGRRLGVLSFERAEPWTDESVRLVEAVVGQLDLALDNARLLEETRLRATQEAARSQIVSRVRALASTDAILRSAAEELGKALQVERSRIQLVRFDS